jgi:lysophospholipase L1-like esterase
MKNILCFGDSNTWGYNPYTKKRYDINTRWTGILQNELKDVRIIEEGLVGRTTVFEDELREGRKGSELLPIILESHAPLDLIILMLGTNDCKTVYNASAEVIGKGIRHLIGQIKNKAANAKILLISPIRLGEKVWEDGYDGEFSENSVKTSLKLPFVYKNIAKENDIYYLAASDYALPSEADREHLDEDGHRALAEGIINYIEKYKLIF